jgi:hypothetical protein
MTTCLANTLTTWLQLLPLIADCADHKIMTILTASSTLKLSYELAPDSSTASLAILQKRRDYSEELATAFEELVTIAKQVCQ